MRAALVVSCAAGKPSPTHKHFTKSSGERSSASPSATKSTVNVRRKSAPTLLLSRRLAASRLPHFTGAQPAPQHQQQTSRENFPAGFSSQRRQASQTQQSSHGSLLLSFHRKKLRGKRERSPPLPQIMQSSFSHLGKSQGSAHPECNG